MNNYKNIASKFLSFPLKKEQFVWIVLGMFLLTNFSMLAQDKKATLQAKKKKLLDEIAFTQKSLDKTKASKDATLADLQALSRQIELRQKLIKEVEGEIGDYTVKINQNIDSLKQKEEQLNRLKKEYAEAIVRTYKTQRFADKLLFVVNANSFSEALKFSRIIFP